METTKKMTVSEAFTKFLQVGRLLDEETDPSKLLELHQESDNLEYYVKSELGLKGGEPMKK